MAWVAVQIQHYNMIPREEEVMFSSKPKRMKGIPKLWFDSNPYPNEILLPKGTIKKLIGRDLAWNDEPVEIK